MKHLNTRSLVTGALLLGLMSTQLPATAETGSNPLANARGSKIVGVWNVNVDLYNCGNGAYITSFPAMHKFELGGTGQVVPAGNSPLSPVHMMVWEYLGNDTYSAVFQFFRYDQNGLIGTSKLTNEVWVSPDGSEYGGFGIAELYDLDGNLVGIAGCPSVSGTRLNADA
jgi:hypothetical protein